MSNDEKHAVHEQHTKDIRALNDFARTAKSCRIVVSQAFSALPDRHEVAEKLLSLPASHFDDANDPYGEHDFGYVDLECGGKAYFKIDYYADSTFEYGSEAPWDPKHCVRVITLMLDSDY